MVTATRAITRCTRPGCGGDIINMGDGPQCLLCSRPPETITEERRSTVIIYRGKRVSASGHQPVFKVVKSQETQEETCYLLDPKPSQKLADHSQDGFNWSYGGSAPNQLGLAILLDATNEEDALRFYPEFTDIYVASWGDKWEMTQDEIKSWVQGQKGGVVKVSAN